MSKRRQERTLARRQAIQMLYQSEILEISPSDVLSDEYAYVDDVTPAAYAQKLVRGVGEHLKDIDSLLQQYADNWSIDRMPLMDLAILRLACLEMRYMDNVPVSVAINEAVDLAKEFGGEDESPKFVNGVLGRIARVMENAEAQGEKAPAASIGQPAQQLVDAAHPTAETPSSVNFEGSKVEDHSDTDGDAVSSEVSQ